MENASDLILRAKQNILSPEEKKELDQWLAEKSYRRIIFNRIMDDQNLRIEVKKLQEIDVLGRWKQFQDTIKIEKETGPNPIIQQFHKWKMGWVATIALVGLLVFYQLRIRTKNPEWIATITNEKINPGQVGATLTLSNGKKIRLKDTGNGELAKEIGVTISKTASGQVVYTILPPGKDDISSKINPNSLNTLSTAKGETYQIRLPDGSLVYLNAASSLTYSTVLNKQKKRSVQLTGEGYFEVAKDKSRPFIVKSLGQEVEVLGTHFNINAYADEPSTKTTLLEGSVRINNQVTLKPNQQAIKINNKIETTTANAAETIAWQKGYFSFYDEDINSIMRKISRWYNVEINYDGELPTEGFNARINKGRSIRDVLEILRKTNAVNFKIEGRKIIVSK